jgi:DNA-binding protein HU-beta
MNKSELIKTIAEQIDIPQVLSKKIVELMLGQMLKSLANGEKVTLTGFGRFSAKSTPSRTRRNPKSGEKVQVSENVAIRFKPSRRAKEQILKVFEHRSTSKGV